MKVAAKIARDHLAEQARGLRAQGIPIPDGTAEVVALLDALRRVAGDDDRSPWMTRDQAADYAHVSVRTVHRWRNDGLPSSTRTGRVLIHRDDLDQWIRTSPDDLPDTTGHLDA